MDGFTNCDGDCDDFDETVFPGAQEFCNGIDDDCNGLTDDNAPGFDYFADNDGDGYGSTYLGSFCVAPANSSDNDLDCDDDNANVNPGMEELCSNDIDDDCDGTIDVVVGACDQPGYSDLTSPCGVAVCNVDPFCCNNSWDGICAGEAASEAACAFCVCGCYDNDMDGYTTCDGDCDDLDDMVNPGMTEVCGNGIDDDCNGQVDENSVYSDYFADDDGDGFGLTFLGEFCDAPINSSLNNLDCDDTNAAINPGMSENCTNGIDDDCDGTTDVVDGACDLPGYSDLTSPCGVAVCNLDPFCCNNSWDAICAGEASAEAACAFCLCGCYDNDMDGFTTCDGDCDDSNDLVFPGADEICNLIDDDCNGTTDDGLTFETYYADADSDGYGDPAMSIDLCSPMAGFVLDDNDCDDTNANINPVATEICDGLDNDCNGTADEGLTFLTYYSDADGDGFGSTLLGDFCNAPPASSVIDGDCNDGNATINPGAMETCDGEDQDCDGIVDNDVVYTEYFQDNDGDNFGSISLGDFCIAPLFSSLVSGDCDDTDNMIYPGATEVCNNQDEDCDGDVDEGLTMFTFYADADGDGWGDPSNSVSACGPPLGYVTATGDCNDNAATIYPNAAELCNDIDDDCDGEVDNDVVYSDYYEDMDGDGYGLDFLGNFCIPPANGVLASGDCEDTNAAVNPGATEMCNNMDDNCNSQIDEGLMFITYYSDNDGDGFGDEILGDFCTAPANSSSAGGDCNDADSSINPGASEFCNDIDEDCDGTADNDVVYSDYFVDADGDGYGSTFIGNFCTPQPNAATNSSDCDDAAATTYPSAIEFCNSEDDDCDGLVDEGLTATPYYADADGDGYGGALLGSFCDQPTNSTTTTGDCDDSNENVNPGATEVCNDTDDDCDGEIDEDVMIAFYQDADVDGYGSMTVSVMACQLPAGYVTNNTDCNDALATVYPGATEYCNSIDDDCNGLVDDNCIDSVEENAANWEVQLYPNPVQEQLYITVVGATGAVNYTVYDAIGKIVFSAKLNSASTINTIDCSILSQGSYTLMLNNNETQVHKKFIKL